MNEKFSDAEMESAIKVFEVLKEQPSKKSLAKTNPRLKYLFELSTYCLMPTNGDKKFKKKETKAKKKTQDFKMLQESQIRISRQTKAVGAPYGPLTIQLPTEFSTVQLDEAPTRNLNSQRACHVCSAKFTLLHHFYDQMCPNCASFNFSKRTFSSNMNGKVCLVTGARVKIGYCIALKLLRMGATVICTSRFPHDAALRYSKEQDFEDFNTRLSIFGIDFRNLSMVHEFCKSIINIHERLDVIINNAAQTVRKPVGFYEHLIPRETSPLPAEIAQKVKVFNASKSGEVDGYLEGCSNNSASWDLYKPQKYSSAEMSQIPLIPHDMEKLAFPQGQLDRDDQQVDLRLENSWVQQLGSISTIEMLECHVINTFAPWVLISNLLPLLEKTIGSKYIVNVSAMEGQFYRRKTSNHPHSNMAKAALNMMTRTSAAGLAQRNIYMTAVDTGWITDENPISQWDKRVFAPPPLDEIDAAMRVLDPVLVGMNGGEKLWGVFLKNYQPTRW